MVARMAEGAELKSENWVMVVSEQHRYQGVSYKSDIIVISGNPVMHIDVSIQSMQVILEIIEMIIFMTTIVTTGYLVIKSDASTQYLQYLFVSPPMMDSGKIWLCHRGK